MVEAWLNFATVIFVQLLFFVLYAYYVKRISDVPRILGQGILIGLVVGLLFDLILGKFFGFNSYTLGFGAFFLIINAAFSYGIFSANILLFLQHARFLYFYVWLSVLIAVYEVTNIFFPVWVWEFTAPLVVFWTLLLVGYSAGALLVSIIAHTFLGKRFSFIANQVKE